MNIRGLTMVKQFKSFSFLEEMKQKARKEFTHFNGPQKQLTALFDEYKMEARFNGCKDFAKVLDRIVAIKEYYKINKPEIPEILHEIQYDVEQNVHHFSIDQLIKLTTELSEVNYVSIPFMDHVQRNIGDRIYFEKNLEKVSSDREFMQALLNYFKNTTDVSSMRVRNLDYILNFFVQRNKQIFNNESTTYDFIWLTSLAIATHYSMKGLRVGLFRYIDSSKNPLTKRGAHDLLYLLDKAANLVNRNHAENSVQKVRLYKALYYMKLEGLQLNDRLEAWIRDFKPYYLLNMENRISNSNLEKSFEKVLVDRNISFKKEKKTDFCMVDYFVEPNFCFEVNGPMHYFDFMVRAKDLLKQRVLEHLNYNVVMVHYNFNSEPYYKDVVEGALASLNEIEKKNEEIKKEVSVEMLRHDVKRVKRKDVLIPELLIPEINH
jgi:hypothetical protein